MSLTPGTRLGPYEITSPLGAGGMGEVYRAKDTRWGRDVAVKVLPQHLSAHPEVRARFELEAKTVSSLNHPNICTLFDVGREGDTDYLVMELIDGETLAQRLVKGALPGPEVLKLGVQIADALDRAHRAGVIHRDLKPGNIMLTRSGAKLMDFGLARATGMAGPAAGSGLTQAALMQSPTIAQPLTAEGTIVGTFQYMAPEQLEGQEADERCDIWALGCVLYEMATGRRAFDGKSQASLISSIMKDEPVPVSQVAPLLPAGLDRLVRTCMTKDPDERVRTAHDVKLQLLGIAEGGSQAGVPAPVAASRRGRPRSAVMVAAVGIAGLALGVIAMLLIGRATRPPAHEAPLRKFHLALPAAAGQPPEFPAISPDGRTVAYLFAGAVWIQSMSELEPRELKVDKDAAGLFWSPDGKSLGYAVGPRIMKISLDGGENQAACDVRGRMDWGGGAGISWGDDGMIVFSRGDSGGVFRVSAAGGDPVQWIRPDTTETDLHQPCVLPGGHAVLFASHKRNGGYNNISLWANGKRKVLLEVPDQRVANPTYDPAGYILFNRTPTTPGIWALPFSLSRLEATGPPFIVSPGGSFPSVSAEGTLACISGGPQGARELAWYDRDGRELGTVGEPEASMGSPALSPDGHRIAWPITAGNNRDIWILDTTRGTRTRLTFDPGSDDGPSWSPSGDRVIYNALPVGATATGFHLLARAADGTGAVDTLGSGAAASVAPDGGHAVYTDFEKNGAVWSLKEVALHGRRTPRTLVTGNPRAVFGRISPQGNFLAYMSSESGQWEVYLTRYPSCEGRWQVSTAGGQSPRWTARGDRLFFLQADDVMEVEVSGTAAPVLGAPKRLFTRPTVGEGTFNFYASFEMTGDGARFLTVRPVGQQGPPQGVAVIQNWAVEFAKKR